MILLKRFGGISESYICIRRVHVLRIWIENNTKAVAYIGIICVCWNHLLIVNHRIICVMYRDAHEHRYMEIGRSPDPGGCAALELLEGDSEGYVKFF
ncbi:hypothetical protein LXL04_015930 [Taraxacum kok-saghyz]